MVKLYIVFLLLVIPFTYSSSFRKERIIKAEEIIDLNKKDITTKNKLIRVETDEGNTYLLSNNVDGILITDALVTDEWKSVSKINLRGYKTVGEVLEEITSLNIRKQKLSNNKENVTDKICNLRLRHVIEQ